MPGGSGPTCGDRDPGGRGAGPTRALVLGGLARGFSGPIAPHLLLPVLRQQQADLRQLLLDDFLVDHVQLQAGLWVFGECLLLGVVLIIADITPSFFFLDTGEVAGEGEGEGHTGTPCPVLVAQVG